MDGGKEKSLNRKIDWKKMLPPILLTMLTLLHLSKPWTQPLSASAATLEPQVQVTFIPDILPVDIEGEASSSLDPDTPPFGESVDPLQQEEIPGSDIGLVSVLPEVGTTHLGYAYEDRYGQTMIHVWQDGQEIILDARDPGTYAYIERFKYFTEQYVENRDSIRSYIRTIIGNVGMGMLDTLFIEVTAMATAAACAATPLTGVALAGCIAGVGALAAEAIKFSIHNAERSLTMGRFIRLSSEQRALREKINTIYSSLTEIATQKEEE
ncbi:MAG: hypothetical protein JXA25_13200 [Anaerolineales bacterium]|nr:hypothetical protein [Anaerolineales bacterium]